MQGHRFEQRKKKRMNQILNIAIGIVVVLILVFGAQILFGSSSTEEAVSDDQKDTIPEELTNPVPEDEKDDPELQDNQKEEKTDSDQEEDEQAESEDELEPVPDGEWEPVGTNQDREFTHDFNRSGENWSEMEKALRYATGLDENMIIWRLENGGTETRARGVVSAPDAQSHPYEVYIEWVDGQGWKPVEKNQLPNNPYR